MIQIEPKHADQEPMVDEDSRPAISTGDPVAPQFTLDPQAQPRPRPAHRGLLTDRERNVLIWVSTGRTAGEIGFMLEISGHTVGEHLKNIRRKLGTANNVHSLAQALKQGELSAHDFKGLDLLTYEQVER